MFLVRALLSQLLTKPSESVQQRRFEQNVKIVVALIDRTNWRQRVVVEELKRGKFPIKSLRILSSIVHMFFISCSFFHERIAFHLELKSGVLNVISVPVEYYPWDLVLNPCALQKYFFESLPFAVTRASNVHTHTHNPT